MTETIGWLAVSLLCAVVGGLLGAAVGIRRAARRSRAPARRDS